MSLWLTCTVLPVPNRKFSLIVASSHYAIPRSESRNALDWFAPLPANFPDLAALSARPLSFSQRGGIVTRGAPHLQLPNTVSRRVDVRQVFRFLQKTEAPEIDPAVTIYLCSSKPGHFGH